MTIDSRLTCGARLFHTPIGHRSVLLLTFVGLLVSNAPLPAQEYSLFGTVSGTAEAHVMPDGEPAVAFVGSAEIRADHRLGYDRVEGVLAHRIMAVPGGDLVHEIDEAYLTVYPTPLTTIHAGRQRLNWGLGYFLSPTDSLHPEPATEDLTAATPERDAFLGLATVLTAGANATLSLVLSGEDALASGSSDLPESEPWELLRYGAHASLFVSPVELTASVVYSYERTFRPGVGVSISTPVAVVYAEGALELHNQVAYPDPALPAAFERPELWTPFPLVAAGFEVPIGGAAYSATATMEYLYYSVGFDDEETETLLSLLRAAPEDVLPTAPDTLAPAGDGAAPAFLRRHYVLGTVALDFAGYASVDLTGVLGLEDGSGVVSGRLTFLALNGADIWLAGTGFAGGPDDEFGMYPDSASYPGRLFTSIGATLHF